MTPGNQSFDNSQVRQTLTEFFTRYLIRRDLESTLELVSDTICSVGTGEDEVAMGKPAFQRILEEEFAALPQSIYFTMTDYDQQQLRDDCWHCFCKMETSVPLPDGNHAAYRMRVTAGLHREGDGYVVDILHASEVSQYLERGEFLPLKFLSRSTAAMSRQTQQELMEIISQIMPGGILGGYVEEGFPLYVANERLLRMAGYDSYEDFEQDIDGKVINTIHPDDREYVNHEMERVFQPSDQYEIQYRMKKKDGTYFWVHDIGRLTVAADGRDAIISVLIDISQQIYTQTCLANEASTDPLTGIYNRKGAQKRIARQMESTVGYLFLMLDLDNFKGVNDCYGHQAGDQALSAVARQLQESFRQSDVVCRIGGDEFAVFVANCTDPSALEKKLQKIIDDYRQRMDCNWPAARSTMSMGGVWGKQNRGFQELYRLADDVLYEVKRSAKGCYKIRVLD